MEPQEIYSKVDKYFEAKGQNFPCETNRASNIGHPCIRHLVYCRLHWDKALPINIYLQKIFEEGNDQEKILVQFLGELGYRIYNQNQSFPKNKLKLTGHIDGILTDINTGEEMPFDIKTCDPNLYPQIQTIDDLSRRYWMQKWIWQIQAYMLLSNYPKFWILLKNKTLKDFRIIEIKEDSNMKVEIEKKCIRINKCVEKNMLPEPEYYNHDVCRGCQYQHMCLPPAGLDPSKIIEDPEFYGMLLKREELEPYSKQYSELDKSIKALIKQTEGNKFLCEDFYIEKKTIHKKSYMVAEMDYEQVKIRRIENIESIKNAQ